MPEYAPPACSLYIKKARKNASHSVYQHIWILGRLLISRPIRRAGKGNLRLITPVSDADIGLADVDGERVSGRIGEGKRVLDAAFAPADLLPAAGGDVPPVAGGEVQLPPLGAVAVGGNG